MTPADERIIVEEINELKKLFNAYQEPLFEMMVRKEQGITDVIARLRIRTIHLEEGVVKNNINQYLKMVDDLWPEVKGNIRASVPMIAIMTQAMDKVAKAD